MSLEDLKQMNCMTITPAIAATCLGLRSAVDQTGRRASGRSCSASRSAVSAAA